MSEMIGRDKEFRQIINIINNYKNEKNLIIIEGDGGTGKTVLLNQLFEYYSDPQLNNVVTMRFDFRDLHSQSVYGLNFYSMQTIYNITDEKNTNIFSDSEVIQFSNYLLSNKLDGNEQQYLDYLGNIFSRLQNFQILLFEDTLDGIFNTKSNYIPLSFKIGALIPNCTAIIAMRPVSTALNNINLIKESLKDNNWNFHKKIILNPFNQEKIKKYFKFNNYEIENNFANDLLFLTNGSPIILSIAIEWELRGNNLKETCRKLLQKKYSGNQKDLISQFNYIITSPYRKLNKETDWVILYLAHLKHRYDRKLFKLLLGLSEEQINFIENDINKYKFMRKSLIKENELLHDEIQKMINDFAWNIIDSDFGIRLKITQKAVKLFYEVEIKNLLQKIKSLAPTNVTDDTKKISARELIAAWNIFMEISSLFIEMVDYKYMICKYTGTRFNYHDLDKQIREILNTTQFVLTNYKISNKVQEEVIYEGLANINPELLLGSKLE